MTDYQIRNSSDSELAGSLKLYPLWKATPNALFLPLGMRGLFSRTRPKVARPQCSPDPLIPFHKQDLLFIATNRRKVEITHFDIFPNQQDLPCFSNVIVGLCQL